MDVFDFIHVFPFFFDLCLFQTLSQIRAALAGMECAALLWFIHELIPKQGVSTAWTWFGLDLTQTAQGLCKENGWPLDLLSVSPRLIQQHLESLGEAACM